MASSYRKLWRAMAAKTNNHPNAITLYRVVSGLAAGKARQNKKAAISGAKEITAFFIERPVKPFGGVFK